MCSGIRVFPACERVTSWLAHVCVRAYVCAHTCTWAFARARVGVCVHMRACEYARIVRVCVCECMRVRLHARLHGCLCVSACVHVCLWACGCVYPCVYVRRCVRVSMRGCMYVCMCSCVHVLTHARARTHAHACVCVSSCACVCTCTYGGGTAARSRVAQVSEGELCENRHLMLAKCVWGMGNIDLGTGRLFVLATLRAVQRQQSGKLPLLLHTEAHGRSRKEEARACARPATDFERGEESQAPASNRWAMADQRSTADGSASTDCDARWQAYHHHGILEVTT